MTHPSTTPTPAATYQGRSLPRPEEDVVDQGLAFDVTTLLTRRNLFRVGGLGVSALALAACTSPSTNPTAATPNTTPTTSAVAQSATTTPSTTTTAASSSTGSFVEIPDETAGPYPGDGSNGANVLTESGIVRRDLRSSFGDATTTAEGIPFSFDITVLNMAAGGTPYAGAAVYAWHCNRNGNYSLYSSGIENENYLRGVQIADTAGKVTFTSIFPACYSGRWPHVHFEVYPDQTSITDATKAIATSQMALPKNICDTVYATTGYEQSITNLSQVTLQADNVFGDDAGIHQMPTVTGNLTAGYVATLTAPVDTRSTPTAGNAPAGGAASKPGGGTPPTGPRPTGTPPSGMGAPPTS